MIQFKFDPRFGMVCISSLASLVGPVILIVVATVLGSIQPNYNPLFQTISSLVLGPFGWIQTVTFFVFGFLLCIFAWRTYASVAKKSLVLKIATALLLLIGMGFFLIGIFHAHSHGESSSLNSMIHDNTAIVISAFFPIVCFLLAFSFMRDSYWRGMFIYTLVTAVIATALLVIGPVWALDSHWVGLYERIFLLNGLIWIEVVSLRLLTTCRTHFQNCCKLSFTRKAESQ